MTIRIIRCHKTRFDALVEFVAAHNPDGTHHIGYFGLTPEDIRLTLRMFNWPFDRAARLAVAGGRIVGVLAADIDRDLGRAWLYGPLVVAEAWDETADALYAALAPGLPAGIGEHEMFVDARNAHGRAFAARHGFETYGEWAIYFLTPDRLAALPPAEAEPWDERYTAQLDALHNRLFPRSNYTLAYLLKPDPQTLLLMATEGDALRGYFFGRVEAEAGEAYVDLIGVDEAARGTGLGRRLMLAGLSRMRATPGLRQVNLTVAADNETARRLYAKLGFAQEREMVAFRRRLAEE